MPSCMSAFQTEKTPSCIWIVQRCSFPREIRQTKQAFAAGRYFFRFLRHHSKSIFFLCIFIPLFFHPLRQRACRICASTNAIGSRNDKGTRPKPWFLNHMVAQINNIGSGTQLNHDISRQTQARRNGFRTRISCSGQNFCSQCQSSFCSRFFCNSSCHFRSR